MLDDIYTSYLINPVIESIENLCPWQFLWISFNVFYKLQVECCAKDLHSGVFGGTVHEAMADLIYLMNTLLDSKGNILVPGKA